MKKVFGILLIVIGGLSFIFAVSCFAFGGTGEIFSATGYFSRTETMLWDIVDNTRLTLECISMGFGFTLTIEALLLVCFGIKNIVDYRQENKNV